MAATKKSSDEDIGFDPIEETLLSNGVHLLQGSISEENIGPCIKWILYENLRPRKKAKDKQSLTLIVSTEGGDLYQTFGLIDVIDRSTIPITTVALGPVMSAGFLIFLSGAHGHRYVGKNATLMCHQYSGGIEAKHHDLKAMMIEGDRCDQRMRTIISRQLQCELDDPVIDRLMQPTDVYINAQQAITMGIANEYY